MQLYWQPEVCISFTCIHFGSYYV